MSRLAGRLSDGVVINMANPTELRRIVEDLEKGEGKLEDSIEAYQKGAALKKHCEQKLREAQERIEKVSLGPDGGPGGSEPLDLD